MDKIVLTPNEAIETVRLVGSTIGADKDRKIEVLDLISDRYDIALVKHSAWQEKDLHLEFLTLIWKNSKYEISSCEFYRSYDQFPHCYQVVKRQFIHVSKAKIVKGVLYLKLLVEGLWDNQRTEMVVHPIYPLFLIMKKLGEGDEK